MKAQSLFISDVHLGYHNCKTQKFLAFINAIECKNIFIVGDLVDQSTWAKKHKWINDNNSIVEKILSFTQKGIKIYYIWGNHDDFLSKWERFSLGENIEICRTKIYTALNQKKYLIIHGDQFDGFLRLKILSPLQKFGTFLYDALLWVNKVVNKIVRQAGCREAYISTFLRSSSHTFHKMITEETKRHKCDGVICGHLHTPQHYENLYDVEYFNCGDWINSCSYIVENLDGSFNLKKFQWEN